MLDDGSLRPRDDEADEALSQQLAADRQLAAELELRDHLAARVPDENLFLMSYREMSDAETEILRTMKRHGAALWAVIKLTDASLAETAEPTQWNSESLRQAGLKVEEALLWAEKHFLL